MLNQQYTNMLNEKGLTTKRNCKWSQNAICRILTNEIYTGKINVWNELNS